MVGTYPKLQGQSYFTNGFLARGTQLPPFVFDFVRVIEFFQQNVNFTQHNFLGVSVRARVAYSNAYSVVVFRDVTIHEFKSGYNAK
mgnify:CR=1 FL=1